MSDMTTDAPWAGRDILDRLRTATFDSVSAEDLADAVAEIERLRAIVDTGLQLHRKHGGGTVAGIEIEPRCAHCGPGVHGGGGGWPCETHRILSRSIQPSGDTR